MATLLRDSAGLWGPAGFAAATVIGGATQRGYDHRRFHISGLAAHGARSAPVMVPGFMTLGAASLLLPAKPPMRTLVRVAGVGVIAAGALRCSDVSCPDPMSDPDATSEDAAHAAVSIVTFVTWTALPFVDAINSRSWARVIKTVLGVLTALGLVAAGATARSDHPHKGVAQRLFLASVFTWYAGTSRSLLRQRRAG